MRLFPLLRLKLFYSLQNYYYYFDRTKTFPRNSIDKKYTVINVVIVVPFCSCRFVDVYEYETGVSLECWVIHTIKYAFPLNQYGQIFYLTHYL